MPFLRLITPERSVTFCMILSLHDVRNLADNHLLERRVEFYFFTEISFVNNAQVLFSFVI